MPIIDNNNHNRLQNVAAISVELHMHPRFAVFYDTCNDAINGFVGAYDMAIGMAEALSDWENERGGPSHAYDSYDLDWVSVFEAYVDAVIKCMIETESTVNYRFMLRELPVLSKAKFVSPAQGQQ